MRVIKRIIDWRDRRHELTQLHYEIADIREIFDREVTEGKLSEDSEEYENVFSFYREATELRLGHIGVIETREALSRAHRWRVPVPAQPFTAGGDNQCWEWNTAYERYFLSLKGHQEIRHAVATEMDIRFRPWLSWGAIVISAISLAIAFVKP